MRRLLDVEAQAHGRARRKRLDELVAAHADALVVFDQAARHTDRQLVNVELGALQKSQTDRADRHRVLVLQGVAATHANALLRRVQRDIERDAGDLHLRLRRQGLVLLLVIRLATLLVVAALVVVEDVGVVEDEAAECDEGDEARAGEREGRAVQSRSCEPDSLAPAAEGAARP